jgi:hypothetical protein
VLRFTLKIITLPQISGGQTLREANFGVVRIGSNVPQGTYNLCAQLTTLKIDCVPLQVELTAASGNHNN